VLVRDRLALIGATDGAAQERSIMRNAIVLGLGLALTSSGCSHATAGSDPSPSLSAPIAANTAGAPAAAAAAPVDAIYRVPVDGLPSLGNPQALVTIVAFTDYQCPFCKRADATITQLRAAYGDQVRIVVAEKPLPMHDRARPAALAALAASAQGAFEKMHARLFAGALDDASITAAATDLGLDLPRFEADRAGSAVAALAQAGALADKLGVRGTPSFFINGRRLVGAQPIEAFRAILDERLTAARALVATGVRPEDVYARTTAGGAETFTAPSEDGTAACAGSACDGKGDGKDAPVVGDKVETVPIDRAPARGSAWSPITIVEFADYQGPYCARAEANLRAVEQAHPGDVRIVFKNRPLPFHDHARAMAKAAVAADAQGRFWPMHDRLFTLTGTIDRAAFDEIARDLGLDVARFDHDLDDPALDARIDADDADATALGVTGTPTFFVNGHRVVGAQPPAEFERAIAKK
jgi:protein-disulfide isomerase